MKRKKTLSMEIRRAQGYLERFGYYSSKTVRTSATGRRPTVRRGYTAGHLDAPTRIAIRAFQRFCGLPITGALTQRTLRMMELPRCGNSDIGPRTRPAWPDSNLSYGFVNFASNLSVDDVRGAVTQALKLWSAVSPLTFKEVPVSQGPIMRMGFFRGDHGDGMPFDGPGGIAGHGFYPPDPSPRALHGDVHFDGDERWAVTLPSNDLDLVSAAIHEIGHAIGLEHSSNQNSVMYPILAPRRTLALEDIEIVQSLYGSRWGAVRGEVTFPRFNGSGPQRVTVSATFSSTIRRAVGVLTGFDALYSDREDQFLGKLEVGVKVLSVGGSRATVSVWLGLRDWTKEWDDYYEGRVSYVVLGEIAKP